MRLRRPSKHRPLPAGDHSVSRLAKLNLERRLGKQKYSDLIKDWQLELLSLQQCAMRGGVRAMINFEGMDAAGKGGSIRRMVEALDPRGYKVFRIGPPEPWEQERHYLYRFWVKVPPPGELVIFDRSWYGRVLVERVEQLVSVQQWKRAYAEINDLERTLIESGVVLVKYWFHVDADEQLRRFEARLANPFKAWKMTDEDWRNRGKWDQYVAAAEEMFSKTDTKYSRWHIIPANDKHFARIACLQILAQALRKRAEQLELDCPKPIAHALRLR